MGDGGSSSAAREGCSLRRAPTGPSQEFQPFPLIGLYFKRGWGSEHAHRLRRPKSLYMKSNSHVVQRGSIRGTVATRATVTRMNRNNEEGRSAPKKK